MMTNRDYVAPARFSRGDLLGTLWAGVAISFCFLLFRFYVRLKIFRRFHIEDPLVFAAWLMNLIYAALWQKNATELYSVIAVESGQISKPPPQFSSYVSIKLHTLLAAYVLYYTALWSIKLSFLLFFRNLGKFIRKQMILWYCVLGYTIATYIACLGMIDYRCLAGSGGLAECDKAAAHYTPTSLRLVAVFDTTTDAFIILISISLLWNASVEFRKKLALIGIFCLTIFIISVSIIRVILTTSGPRLDLTWLLLWSGLETTVAITVACIASFRILYTRSERFRRGALHSKRAANVVSDDPGIPLHARLALQTSITTRENPHHKRHMSTDTFEEAILPMHSIYLQHRYTVFSRPREGYEEIRAALETPAVRLHNHRSPSSVTPRDTVSYGSEHLEY